MFFCFIQEQAVSQQGPWFFFQPAFDAFNFAQDNNLQPMPPQIYSQNDQYGCQVLSEPVEIKNTSKKQVQKKQLIYSQSKNTEFSEFDEFPKRQPKIEEQFKPYMAYSKRERRIPQNVNRNVLPNVMHQVISFIQKRSKSGKLVERAFARFPSHPGYSIKRFYLYQLLIKDKLNHYVSKDSLMILKQIQEPNCEVYTRSEQEYYNKISRILVFCFLNKQYDSIILTSKRVNSEKKIDHVMAKRELLEELSELFCS